MTQFPQLKIYPSVGPTNNQAERKGQEMTIKTETPDGTKRAFIGVRSCELQAIAIQDQVFLQGEAADPHYQSRRQDNFIIAVNCGQAGGTCFCVSMQTGPKATNGFDLALTEILEPTHSFVVEVGSDAGRDILQGVSYAIATPTNQAVADQVVTATAQHMGRTMPTEGIKDLLYHNLEHSRWDDVASRCLTCANCTMVCPTCFCSTVEDTTDLTGDHAERWRHWDSCFTMDFSYLHGGSVRVSAKSRYRQWMTHKFTNAQHRCPDLWTGNHDAIYGDGIAQTRRESREHLHHDGTEYEMCDRLLRTLPTRSHVHL